MKIIHFPFLFLMLMALSCGDPDKKGSVKRSQNNKTTNNKTTNNKTIKKNNRSNNQRTSNNLTSTNNLTRTNNLTSTNNTPDPTNEVDILWVIDNSGSMCQEQDTIRSNFNLFVDELARTKKDFHLSVTTTHMRKDHVLETVAIPGHIQSQPQPIPGFDRTCINAIDNSGVIIPTDYRPIRKAISTAVNCMKTPNTKFNNFTNKDFECAINGQEGCKIRGVCGGAGKKCRLADLFPEPKTYRKIPKVLRYSDYNKGNAIDKEKLKADFACMSFVGTRGYGIEKGLSAAALSMSPKLTGNAVGAGNANTKAPNHGFLRKDSRFALIFASDENDCSHDGSLDEDTNCGDAVCEYANIKGADAPLFKISKLKKELIDNLKSSKGRANFSEKEMVVASIHGTPQRFSGTPKVSCDDGDTGVRPVCASALGRSYTGDRYQEFLDSFPVAYPKPTSATQGWMCKGDFSPALALIGELVADQK